MPVEVLKFLRKNAAQMAYNSALYNWSLRGARAERLLVRPVDSWPGKAAQGQVLCEGHLPAGYDSRKMHSFGYLRDLEALARQKGCAQMAKSQARTLVESWIQRYPRWEEGAWDGDVTGERIAMWISHYEFYSEITQNADEDYHFDEQLFDAIARQACHLSRILSHGEADSGRGDGIGTLKAARGLLYAGLAFEGQDAWAEQAIEHLLKACEQQIAGDGMHKSRCPERLMSVLQILLDVRSALSAAARPMPEALQHVMDKMGPALQFFRAPDRRLAVFHGGQEADADLIDAVLVQAGVRGKGQQSLPCSGFERLVQGRSSIVFDCGYAPDRDFGSFAHNGPLAFEMSYGRERLFVNCGTHPSDPEWQQALRATAAHNTFGLDHRDAFDIRESVHFSKKPKNAASAREDAKKAILIEASHNGYEKLNGFVHTRRLYLSDKGHDLRGEDTLMAADVPAKAIDAALRFHLHPRVKVSLVNDGQGALLRLPGGTGWRFHHSAGLLALEDSVYLGEGAQPRKTKQLVIYGQVTDKMSKISWVVRKEG